MAVNFQDSDLITVEFLDFFLDDAKESCSHWAYCVWSTDDDPNDIIGSLLRGSKIKIGINERFGYNILDGINGMHTKLTEEENEGDKYVYLTYDRLMEAFSKEKNIADIVEDYDALICDRVIQNAVFGDIILD
jgi:hypothetical protein